MLYGTLCFKTLLKTIVLFCMAYVYVHSFTVSQDSDQYAFVMTRLYVVYVFISLNLDYTFFFPPNSASDVNYQRLLSVVGHESKIMSELLCILPEPRAEKMHQIKARNSPPPQEPCSINTLTHLQTWLGRVQLCILCMYKICWSWLRMIVIAHLTNMDKLKLEILNVSPFFVLLCTLCMNGTSCLPPHLPRCSNGYFGQPSVPGSTCQPCDCNDNLDLSLPGSCDPITGQCLRCRQGYGGASCGICAEGYYGDAVTAKNCQRE